MDAVLFRYHMGRNGDTQETLAEALGMSQSGLSSRINGHVDFRQNEMNMIRARYQLTAEEMQNIFFAGAVSKKDTTEG